MKKTTLSSIFVFNAFTLALIVLIFSLVNLEKESVVFGQNNNATNLNSTKFDALFSTEAYKTCAMANVCAQTIKVLYESPTTIVLTSEYADVLWQSVDLIKKDGYKIDGFTSYSAEAALSTLQPS